MRKVHCEACGASYEVDPRRIPPNGMKMRCPACGASVQVAGSGAAAGASQAAAAPAGHDDLELDLPAPKAAKPAPGAPRLPPMAASGKLAPPAELELSDLPAVKPPPSARRSPLATRAADDLTDLPARAIRPDTALKQTGPAGAPRPGAPSVSAARPPLGKDAGFGSSATKPQAFGTLPDAGLDLPATKPQSTPGKAPNAALALDDLPGTKPAPTFAKAPSAGLEIDLPAPATRPQPTPGKAAAARFEIDLPAPVTKPQPTLGKVPSGGLEIDLPAPATQPQPAAGRAAQASAGELPAPRPRPPLGKERRALPNAPTEPPPSVAGSEPAPIVSAAELPAPVRRDAAARPAARAGADAAHERRDAPTTPKKSFAKPSLASEAKKGLVGPPEPSSAGGTLPKDSLALEPKPFFADTAPLGMFGKLDDVADAPAPNPQLIDLPAPHDLPAVKRAAGPKATVLGLGGRLPKDSLDVPPSFGVPAITGPGLEPAPLSAREPAALPPLEIDLPAPRDLPAVKPVPSRQERGGSPPPAPPGPAALPDIDLPAPRDLPTVKKRPPIAATALGLGSPLSQAAGQTPRGAGGFEVQPVSAAASFAQAAANAELSLDLPPMSGREPQAELDLGEFESALDNFESKGGGSFGAFHGDLDLPPGGSAARKPGSFGDLEPIVLPSVNASNTNVAPLSTMELSPDDLLLGSGERGPGGAGERRGNTLPRQSELGLELRGMLDLSSPPADTPLGPRGSLANFGELDLGVGRESSVGLPLAMPARRPTEPGSAAQAPAIEDAELVGDDGELEPTRGRYRRGRGSVPGWVAPLGLLLAIGAGGAALGLFTQHGYFGVYLMEQLLPAAGDPAHVKSAIEQAERQAKSDTYVEVRKALMTLSDARNEAGLNRPLLARSLLHEALYQLRFGEDAQSAQRSAAILARALERGADAPELTVARAADAARRGELSEAKQLLTAAPSPGDAYQALLRGELALLEKQPRQAADAFAAAVKQGEKARGSWGLARALAAASKHDEAERAARATLAASSRHSGAHTLLAECALARGELDAALSHARVASGMTPVDGVHARPARAERARALAIEGRVEEQRDHPREAQAAYDQALRADPLSVDVLLGSGRMLMRLGRPQDALSRFDSALSAKPGATRGPDGRHPQLEAGLGAIQALLALQRREEALARAQALSAQFPGEAEAVLWYGHALAALERWEEAEASFRDTMTKAPKLFAGYVALSQLLFKRNRPEEAARVLSLAAGQVDDGAEVRRMLGHSELARRHLREAIQQFEAALRFNPRDPGALFGLAVARRQSGAVGPAEQALKQLEEADPTFPGLALERGQLLEQRGDYAGAIAAYRKDLAERPNDSELKLRLGAALVTAGEIDEAEAVLTQVLRERPTSAEAEHYLGRVLFARRDTAQAVQRFERAVNFDPLKAEYHMYLAWALLDQGNFGGALAAIQDAIERDQNLADARWLLGRIQLRTGAVRDALVNFQAALRLKPGRVEALADMGDAYDELRDLPQAIKSYQEALARAPDNAEWWYRLGQLQLDRGSRDGARSALSEAVQRGDRLRDRPSWLADAHRAYGDVLRESKRNAEAAEHYRLFLELAPLGHPDRAEIEQVLFQTRR